MCISIPIRLLDMPYFEGPVCDVYKNGDSTIYHITDLLFTSATYMCSMPYCQQSTLNLTHSFNEINNNT